MKIAFVNHPISFPVPPQRGSVQIWVHAVARRLVQSHNVIVYGLRGELPPTEQSEGIFYRRVSVPEWLPGARWRHLLNRTPLLWRIDPSSVESRWHQWGYGLAVANDLRRQKCDLVHVMNLFHLVPLIRALNPRAKIVLHMHCEWLSRLNRALVRRRLKRVDLVLGCSQHVTEEIRHAFPQLAGRCRTVFNAVDPDCFAPNGTRTMKPAGEKRVFWAGRVSPEKGIHVLLDAFAEVAKHYPEAQLEIVGPEERLSFEVLLTCDDAEKLAPLAPFYNGKSYLSQLQARVAALNLTTQVIFRGHLPRLELVKRYQNADVVVVPSYTEAFSLTLPEAMACQVPVVGTRVGGTPEAVVDGKTGILVEPGNACALAEAILRLLSDDNLRESMGKAGRQRVLELFSWDKVAQDLLHRYQEI
jgi:spore coat protein SA